MRESICHQVLKAREIEVIVYNVKKKLGCIFVENHNSEPLQRGQTIGFVTSCKEMQEELGQRLEKHQENTQSLTGGINDTETCIVGANVGNVEKAG